MTHQAAIGAQESAAACHDLSNIALNLQEAVGRFRVNESNVATAPKAVQVVPPRRQATPTESYRIQ